MIIDTGGRTDTVNHYTEWLLNRFSEGYVLVRNPLFPGTVVRYELDPSVVDCVVFCSKDYRPIMPRLHEITDRFNTFFHYTITPYGRDVEPGVPPKETCMESLVELSEAVGRQRVAWRYDPVLLTDRYTVESHLESFSEMADVIAPHVGRCIFSFVEMYRKLERNMPELVPLTDDDKVVLAEGLGRIAREHGMPIQTCGTDTNLSRYGIETSGCITLGMLGEANGVMFRDLKHKGTRKGCSCIESRDMGAYDTCPNGCRYCYANNDMSKVAANRARHDPRSPLLIGGVGDGDRIVQGQQRSFLRSKRARESERLSRGRPYRGTETCSCWTAPTSSRPTRCRRRSTCAPLASSASWRTMGTRASRSGGTWSASPTAPGSPSPAWRTPRATAATSGGFRRWTRRSWRSPSTWTGRSSRTTTRSRTWPASSASRSGPSAPPA